MTTKRMKSNEVRINWRDVLDHVRHGGQVVVEHYNRPIARITPYVEELTMTTTTPTGHILISAQTHDLVPGTVLGADDCPLSWRDLPADAQQWATAQGYGPDDPDEYIYVLDAAADETVPAGFETYRVEAAETTTYTRTTDEGTETIAVTRTGEQVREVYTVDGQVLDDAIVAGPGSRDADTYLHERDVDLRADGWTA